MPAPQKQTLRQAKSSYASRGRPTLSAVEQKQLERSLLLDRRAWGLKEREKKRADALKKRQERERREREEEAKKRAGLGGQRRWDRFGYASSQFCLGKFFGKDADVKVEKEEEVVAEDGFGDGDVDDETLLGALQSPDVHTHMAEHAQSDPIPPDVMSSSVTPARRTHTESIPSNVVDQLDDFWDELESSTQIARELASETPTAGIVHQEQPAKTVATSFGIESDVSTTSTPRARHAGTAGMGSHGKLMPPPALPARRLPASRIAPASSVGNSATGTRSPKGPPAAPPQVHAGFSMTELESFVDDDLQLTQIAPG